MKPKKKSAKPKKSVAFSFLFPLLIFLLAFAQYANTLTHNYAWDDEIVITKNEITQKGLTGLGEIWTTGSYIPQRKVYRPVTQTTFALEKQFFGNNPAAGHFFNVLYYALCCIFLFFVLKKLFRKAPPLLLFCIAALFVVHPVHTEVVANIKSRDEILALLFSLGSIFYFIKYLDNSKILNIGIAILFFGLGCLSKLNAITILAVFPLIYLFRKAEKKPFLNSHFLKDFFQGTPTKNPETLFPKASLFWQNTNVYLKVLFWGLAIAFILFSSADPSKVSIFAALLLPVLYLTFFNDNFDNGEALLASGLLTANALLFGWKSVALFLVLFFFFKTAASQRHQPFRLQNWWPVILPVIALMGTHAFLKGLGILAFLLVLTFLFYKKLWYALMAVTGIFLGTLLFGKNSYHFNMIVFGGALVSALLFWQNKNRLAFLPILLLLPLSVLPRLYFNLDAVNAYQTLDLEVPKVVTNQDGLAYDITNNSLILAKTPAEKWATIGDIQLRYLAKLFFPHPLVHHYGYNSITLKTFDHFGVKLSLFLHLFLLLAGLYFLCRGNPIGFGILFYFITISIYTNIVLLAPDTMAERFLFFPSAGFCIAIIFILKYLLNPDFKKHPLTAARNISFLGIILMLSAAFFILTFIRNKDWKDPVTLISNTLPNAPNNAALHAIYGAEWTKYLMANPTTKEAPEIMNNITNALERAIEIAPDYYNARVDLGVAYIRQKKIPEARSIFEKAEEINPKHPLASLYLGFIALEERRNEACIEYINAAFTKNDQIASRPNLRKHLLPEANQKQGFLFLGRAYAFTGQLAKAKATLQQGTSKFPGDSNFMKVLAGLQEQAGDIQGAIESYKAALSINKNDQQTNQNLQRLLGR